MPILDVLQNELWPLEYLVTDLASLAHDILDHDFFSFVLAVLVFDLVELVVVLRVV